MSFDREKSIFLAALDLPSGEARESYLASECGDDRELHLAVCDLLSAHDRSINVLDQETPQRRELQGQVKSAAEAIALNATWERGSDGSIIAPDTDGNSFIGNYVLLEKLGEGGFGQVYVAEQREPVRRRVAIKLLKATALSAEAVARFEAERQALAMMDHPNIARIFDGGTTSTGQPYFVMELVRGVHITRFCREHDLSVVERLELFLDVCHAVQHAHQKGIIHRDLKPSNVLVTLHDADAVVKVIDFGVAKAIHEPLTDRTIYTRFAQMIGTPMYMSPEQAEMNSLDVDTRSDIYSLGVLLYELLTEQTPFDQHRLQTASFDEMRRMIREEDPPRPSARLTSTTRLATTRNTHRTLGERSLASELKGDLDWVVMKALEKDRRRRYETAADLARDVQRFLEQQPVVARPPSHWYRFSRFARRNRTVFLSTVIVVLALLTSSIVSTWQAVRATIAQQKAVKLQKEQEEYGQKLIRANVLLDSARANADEQRWQQALEQYTEATQLQRKHYPTWSGRGDLLARLGGFHLAVSDYKEALVLDAPANNPSWWGVPQLCYFTGEAKAYQDICARLKSQMRKNDDIGQISMIARGILLQPISREEAVPLASQLESELQFQEEFARLEQQMRGRGDFRRSPDGGPRGGPGGGPGGRGGPPEMMRDILTYTAGVANVRAGNARRAIELLTHVRDDDPRHHISKLTSPLLALAYHDLGQDTKAKQELAIAHESIDDWLKRMTESPESEYVPRIMPWFDFLELKLWSEEAEAAINGQRGDDDLRLQQMEFRARQWLHDAEAAVEARK